MSFIKRKLFKECVIENLPLWQCPSFLFFVMGLLTILILTISYFVASLYLSLEVLVISELSIAGCMLIISYLVNQGVNKVIQARRATEVEKRKTELIIRNLTDGLIILDRNQKVILVNPKAETLLGMKEKEVLDKKPSAKIGEDKLESFYKIFKDFKEEKKMEQLLTKKAIKEEIEISVPFPKILEISRVKLEDRKGETLAFLNILHDVTKEKEIDKMKSEFISITSHQLSTPLSSLKWLLDLLIEEKIGKVDPKQKDLLKKIYQTNEHMIKIVEDLLNVARIEEGRAKIELKGGNIEKLIEGVILSVKLRAQKKRIELEYTLSPQRIPVFRFDPEKIKLALLNIINNAIQYTPEKGKVTLEILRKPREIEVRIKDTGVGIPQKEQFKVFSKFYRGSNIKQMKVKGTGLGLYITKSIIQAHGGKMWFVSQERKGTTFYFTLPIK